MGTDTDLTLYLPMKNKVRTKVILDKWNGMRAFQQVHDRSSIWQVEVLDRLPWERVFLTNEIIKQVIRLLREKHLLEYPGATKELLQNSKEIYPDLYAYVTKTY